MQEPPSCTLLDLSTELLIEILAYLPVDDLSSVQWSCRMVGDIIADTAYFQYIMHAPSMVSTTSYLQISHTLSFCDVTNKLGVVYNSIYLPNVLSTYPFPDVCHVLLSKMDILYMNTSHRTYRNMDMQTFVLLL